MLLAYFCSLCQHRYLKESGDGRTLTLPQVQLPGAHEQELQVQLEFPQPPIVA